jgi:hypothetical protein
MSVIDQRAWRGQRRPSGKCRCICGCSGVSGTWCGNDDECTCSCGCNYFPDLEDGAGVSLYGVPVQYVLNSQLAVYAPLSDCALRILMVLFDSLGMAYQGEDQKYRSVPRCTNVEKLISAINPDNSDEREAEIVTALYQLIQMDVIQVNGATFLSLEVWGHEQVICYRVQHLADKDEEITFPDEEDAAKKPASPQRIRPSWVYLVHSTAYSAVKVGISVSKVNRVKQHTEQGWREVLSVEVASADTARTVERAVLSHLRTEMGIPPCLTPEQMPQGGWTETASTMQISVVDMESLVKQFASQHKAVA